MARVRTGSRTTKRQPSAWWQTFSATFATRTRTTCRRASSLPAGTSTTAGRSTRCRWAARCTSSRTPLAVCGITQRGVQEQRATSLTLYPPFAGSGSTYIYGFCDEMYKDGMTKQECVDFVRKCKDPEMEMALVDWDFSFYFSGRNNHSDHARHVEGRVLGRLHPHGHYTEGGHRADLCAEPGARAAILTK